MAPKVSSGLKEGATCEEEGCVLGVVADRFVYVVVVSVVLVAGVVVAVLLDRCASGLGCDLY